MKQFTQIASIFALALVVLALPSIASAQYRDDDYYYGRNGNGSYGSGNYYRNIRGTIQNLKNRARNFERRLDRIDDRYDDRYDDQYGRNNDRYGRNNNNRYDNLEELSDRFSRATNDLAGAYGNGRDMNNSRDEARRVLDLGSQIENSMYNSRTDRNAANEWNQIRNDLRVLSDAYRLNYGNRNRNRTSDWRNQIPFPLPF